MTPNRRIEQLENRLIPAKKIYRIVPKGDETPEEARQRYCQENNVTEADLEAGFVIQVVFVSPGDVKAD